MYNWLSNERADRSADLLSYRRDLNNLSIQAGRLRRLYEEDGSELKHLIDERQQTEENRQEDEKRRWQIAITNFKAAKEYKAKGYINGPKNAA